VKLRSTLPAWLLLAIGMMAVIVLLLTEDLGGSQLNTLLLYLPGIDKVMHFAQSLAVCSVLYWLLGRTRLPAGTRLMLAVGGALTAAVFDEVQQSWTAERTVELADLGAGVSGIIVAGALLTDLRRHRLAAVVVLIGLTLGGFVTYDSYRRTHDYNNGVLADRQGRPDEALQHYLRAVEAGVEHPEVYNAAAWSTLETGGDARQAVEFAGRSLALRPGNPDTLDTYGWALFRAGRVADAVAPLEAALAAKPDIYCIHYHLGAVYRQLGRREEGDRHLREQLERMPYTREAILAKDLLAQSEQSLRDLR